MTRAAAIIIQDNTIALIQRQRDGRLYHVFPGGGIEENETPEQAVIREVKEELGLDVRVERLIAEVHYRRYREIRTQQYYFLVSITGGIFGTGTGPEMQGLYPPQSGTYLPVWLPASQLSTEVVHPQPIALLVGKAVEEGWPPGPVAFIEEI
jgi:mutator protein MutT